MKREAKIWSAIAAAPLAWFVLLLVSWAVTPAAHEPGHLWALRILHLAALLVVIGSGIYAWREHERLRAIDSDDDIMQRARFVAMCAVGLAVLFAILVIGSSIPTFLLLPGAEP